MKTSEDFLNEVYTKAKVEKARIKKKRKTITAFASCACALVIVFGTVVVNPSIAKKEAMEMDMNGVYSIAPENIDNSPYSTENTVVAKASGNTQELYNDGLTELDMPDDLHMDSIDTYVLVEEVSDLSAVAYVIYSEELINEWIRFANENCKYSYTLYEWDNNDPLEESEKGSHYYLVSLKLGEGVEKDGFTESIMWYMGDVDMTNAPGFEEW